MIEKLQNFYLFTTFAITFDEHHVKRNLIHLIFLFYTEKDLNENLLTNEQKYKLLLLRVCLPYNKDEDNLDLKIINHNNLFVEVRCSLFNFVQFENVDNAAPLYERGGVNLLKVL